MTAPRDVTAIVLGVGAPNRCRDGRRTMCALLVSPEIGLFRVYPVPGNERFPVWTQVRATISRHTKDNRTESWRLDACHVVGQVKRPVDKRSILEQCVLRSGAVDPIGYQNNLRQSIALVELERGTYGASMMQRQPVAADDDEHGWVTTQAEQFNKPYLEWTSRQGSKHKTHIVGREAYEGLRHFAGEPWKIFSCMQLNNAEYRHWALLGNMRNRRNVWVCVHLHRLKRTPFPSLALPGAGFFGCTSESWPYAAQAADNRAAESNQLLLFQGA